MPCKTIQKQRQNLGMVPCISGGGALFGFSKINLEVYLYYVTVSLFLCHNQVELTSLML